MAKQCKRTKAEVGKRRATRRARVTQFIGLSLLGALQASCVRLDDPSPPDMSALIEAYETPNGVLSPELLKQVLENAKAALLRAEDLNNFEVVSGVIDATTKEALSDAGKATDGSGNPALRAVVKVHHACPGDAEEPAPKGEGENGHLELTLKADTGGLEPVIWGNFVACKLRLKGKPVYLNGAIEVFDQRSDGIRTTTFFYEGELEVDGVQADGQYDFRVVSGEQGEVRIGLNEEYFVIGLDPESEELLVRDRDDEWRCNAPALRCRIEGGDTEIEAPP